MGHIQTRYLIPQKKSIQAQKKKMRKPHINQKDEVKVYNNLHSHAVNLITNLLILAAELFFDICQFISFSIYKS